MAIKMNLEIPYFIQKRGCINCSASKSLKEKTGKDYGFDHEIGVRCVIQCAPYNFNLTNPFLDVEETVRMARKFIQEGKHDKDKIKENTRKYCMEMKEKYGKFYEKIGVSLDKVLAEVDSL